MRHAVLGGGAVFVATALGIFVSNFRRTDTRPSSQRNETQPATVRGEDIPLHPDPESLRFSTNVDSHRALRSADRKATVFRVVVPEPKLADFRIESIRMDQVPIAIQDTVEGRVQGVPRLEYRFPLNPLLLTPGRHRIEIIGRIAATQYILRQIIFAIDERPPTLQAEKKGDKQWRFILSDNYPLGGSEVEARQMTSIRFGERLFRKAFPDTFQREDFQPEGHTHSAIIDFETENDPAEILIVSTDRAGNTQALPLSPNALPMVKEAAELWNSGR